MKVGDVLAVIQRFFLDFIGTIIPGFSLMLGAWLVASKPLFLGEPLFPPANDFTWILLVVGSYVVGHGVTSFGENYVLRVAARLATWLRKARVTAVLAPSWLVSEHELMAGIRDSDTYTRFVARYEADDAPAADADKAEAGDSASQNIVREVRDWRNVAMSVAGDERETIYRFTFLSLLNLGVATVLWLLPLCWLGLHLIGWAGIDFLGAPAEAGVGVALAAIVLGLFVSLLFLERRFRFYRVTMSLPFAMALGQDDDEDDDDGAEAEPGALQTVYLAGRCKPAWRDAVKRRVTGVRYLDPCADRPREAEAAALWTWRALAQSDLVLAYADKQGTNLYRLALELGYARALGKQIVLVEDALPERRAFGMVRAAAGKTFGSLEACCAFVTTLVTPEAAPPAP